MTKRTMQEEFDIVVEHLATQKERSADSEGQCLYRGPNGLKCAIGALIPEEEYLPEFDDLTGLGDNGIESLIEERKPTSLSPEHLSFYELLQSVHDRDHSWGDKGFEAWSRLKRVARDYNLNTKTLDKYLK